MTVEVTPRGVACNLACTYCYQHPMRDAGNTGAHDYDLDAIKRTLAAKGESFTVFGGEALLTPIDDLGELFRFGLEQYTARAAKAPQRSVPNGVQTNGALVTDAHIALFKRYQVHVGFSIDGPGELNDARWAGTTAKTREATARSQAALERCLAEGIGTSLILTLHRGNVGTPERLARIKAWLRDLDSKGLASCRLHVLEVDHPDVAAAFELTPEENVALFVEMARFESELERLRFDVFADIEAVLARGDDNVTCTWGPCDPYTTPAVQGVDGAGNLSNCGRTNKDGVAWLKADQNAKERQLALYYTPQEYGGCQGCRFFLMCKGQCPGTAIDGDWRNRSRDCETWQALLEYKERELLDRGVIPRSVAPRRAEREHLYLESLWSSGSSNQPHGDHTDHGDSHGDHTDYALTVSAAPVRSDHGDDHGDHTDRAIIARGDDHGDVPHGDHTDYGRLASARVPVVQLVRRTAG